jgi:hypothetical protein
MSFSAFLVFEGVEDAEPGWSQLDGVPGGGSVFADG